MNKTLVGSSLLLLDNCRDVDWLTTVDHVKDILGRFKIGAVSRTDFYASWALFQFSAPFHPEDNYIFKDFNIFEYKEIWIRQLKGYINSIDLEKIALKQVLPKWYYQYVYQYYMIIENVHFISAEAKAEVQKIHDLEVPGSYIYRIKELIDSL